VKAMLHMASANQKVGLTISCSSIVRKLANSAKTQNHNHAIAKIKTLKRYANPMLQLASADQITITTIICRINVKKLVDFAKV
jgi:hypothetical protein